MKVFTNLMNWNTRIDSYKANFKSCKKISCPIINQCQQVFNDKMDKFNNCIYPKQLLEIEKLVSHNTTTDTFLTDIATHITGESTPSLALTHTVLETFFDAPSSIDSLDLEKDRIEIGGTNINRDGTTIKVKSSFLMNQANCLETTISSVTDEYTFDLNDTTGLVATGGERLRIFLPTGYEEVRTQSVSGSTVTLDTPLSQPPSGGETVRQLLGRIVLVSNGTGSPDSGTPVSLAQIFQFKSNTEIIAYLHTINLR